MLVFQLICKSDDRVAGIEQAFYSESGMVGAAWGAMRAFPREPPPEKSSRVRRVTALKVCGVSAPKARRKRRIAGGTAEGLPFVPNVWDEGLLFFVSYL